MASGGHEWSHSSLRPPGGPGRARLEVLPVERSHGARSPWRNVHWGSRPATGGSGSVRSVESASYRHIACLVDDSALATAGARFAGELARAAGATLSLVNVAPSAQSFVGGVTPWSDDMAEIDDQLREQAADWLSELAGELEGEGVVLQGSHPGEIALVWAEEQGVDLLVVAPHRGRLARIALGSVASYVATNATCAVLIVRGEAIDAAAADSA